MSILEVSPVGQDSKGQSFSVHLNELVEDIKQYLECGEGTISEKCCKMMEEAFECLEKFSLNRDTFEQVASVSNYCSSRDSSNLPRLYVQSLRSEAS